VDCSCYSEYLSKRDHEAFAAVFEALGIAGFVHYNTFNKICENVLNETCNVREKIRDAIDRNGPPRGASKATKSPRPRVLLIDEVDVFLSDRYYGGMYVPSLLMSGGHFKAILDYVWSRRGRMNPKGTGYEVQVTIRDFREEKVAAYNECLAKHGKWQELILEAVKDMIYSLKSFLTMHYRVEDDTVKYLEGETYVGNIMHGYQTVWTYYHEYEQGKITAAGLVAKTGLILNCGLFSYAEIPSYFKFIAGVTGTLQTLSTGEHDILRKSYGMESQTFMPSVFGENVRNYNPAADIQVVSRADYYDSIKRDIHEKVKARRAALVFFQSVQELMKFHEATGKEFAKDGHYQIIAENVVEADRELRVKRAGTEGMITLLSAAFGRGTDFVCRNPQLLSNGGVHVLQTFYSEEKSEEYQIMGRGARQGDRGSYSMILLDESLEWLLGSDYRMRIDDTKAHGKPLHVLLEKEREIKYDARFATKAMGIAQRKREHESSVAFMDSIQNSNFEAVMAFLKNCNKLSIGGASRTILLMDATGSMSASLEAAKETVCTMFERASAIFADHNIDPNCFQMQFAVYRNYNTNVLEHSTWESNPAKLRDFMSRIRPSGGMGNEAIEIGLAHAADQHEEMPIDQVILIGDMPPNTRAEVHAKKQSWSSTLMGSNWISGKDHYWEDELKRLNNVPVHGFYVNPAAQTAFEEIARRQSGRCESLHINSIHGAESLTALVTEEILRKAGGAEGHTLVEDYRKRYSRRYTS